MIAKSMRFLTTTDSLFFKKSAAFLVGPALFALILLAAFQGGTVGADPLYLERDTLVASNYETESDAAFGSSVAVSGDTVVVGTPDENGSRGAAYVYTRPTTGWTEADATTETAKLTIPGLAAGAAFGSSVSISGDTIVVGASNENGHGAAYVFVRSGDTWTSSDQHDARLAKDSPAFLDTFGNSVSISGDTIVVGAPVSNDTGEAFVFVRPPTGWITATPTAVLSSTLSVSEDDFGSSVAVNAGTIVVGARYDDVDDGDGSENTREGSAYVYVEPESGWVDTGSAEAHLTANNGDQFDLFGVSVGIREDGEFIVVGAEGAALPDESTTQGLAYVFQRPGGGWAAWGAVPADDIILSSGTDGAINDYFGRSVSISGDTIVVGAEQAGVGSNANQGAAYVFVQPTVGLGTEAWITTDTATAKLANTTDGAISDEFGHSVAVFGGIIVAGVPGDDVPVPGAAGEVERSPNSSDVTQRQGSALVFVNGYCSAQSGNWYSLSTWEVAGETGASVPTISDDACISTGHTVTMNAAPAAQKVDAAEVISPTVRRLLVNPSATLDLNVLDVAAEQSATNNGTLIQQKAQNESGWVEIVHIENNLQTATRYLGTRITSPNDLGGISVTLRSAVDWFSPTKTFGYCTETGSFSPNYAGRCFDIRPTNDTLSATVRLWVLEDDLNGIAENELAVYRRVGDTYEELFESAATGNTLGYAYAEAVTPGFSAFLAGMTGDSPTSITFLGVTVDEVVSVTAVLGVVAAFLALATAGLLLLVRRRTA